MAGRNLLSKIFYFYYEGFKNMTVGKKLWLIIFIKLFIFFVIMRLFFFPDFLKSRFETNQERSNYILEELTK